MKQPVDPESNILQALDLQRSAWNSLLLNIRNTRLLSRVKVSYPVFPHIFGQPHGTSLWLIKWWLVGIFRCSTTWAEFFSYKYPLKLYALHNSKSITPQQPEKNLAHPFVFLPRHGKTFVSLVFDCAVANLKLWDKLCTLQPEIFCKRFPQFLHYWHRAFLECQQG